MGKIPSSEKLEVHCLQTSPLGLLAQLAINSRAIAARYVRERLRSAKHHCSFMIAFPILLAGSVAGSMP